MEKYCCREKMENKEENLKNIELVVKINKLIK
jgi:hypothetical protein